uniref:Protein KTI12 homolog n=1 Tax=Cacopsylla melanoneura TaxID=428564 RepID=A0A8D9BMG9_9HEMI
MPLIILTGYPCSGKTKRSEEIKKYFEDQNLTNKIVHIKDNETIQKAGFSKTELYASAQKEKEIRAKLKSEVTRLLNKDTIVILDSMNYIKGYRYELFCVSKQVKSTQCTIEIIIDENRMNKFNQDRSDESEKYDEDTLKALVMRYEPPDHKNRWDSPLITIQTDDPTPLEEIHKAVLNVKPPKSNKSTLYIPLSSNTYLFELDKITQTAVQEILNKQEPSISKLNCDTSKLTLPHLTRLKRQYINLVKLNPATSVNVDNVHATFLQFINSNSDKE